MIKKKKINLKLFLAFAFMATLGNNFGSKFLQDHFYLTPIIPNNYHPGKQSTFIQNAGKHYNNLSPNQQTRAAITLGGLLGLIAGIVTTKHSNYKKNKEQQITNNGIKFYFNKELSLNFQNQEAIIKHVKDKQTNDFMDNRLRELKRQESEKYAALTKAYSWIKSYHENYNTNQLYNQEKNSNSVEKPVSLNEIPTWLDKYIILNEENPLNAEELEEFKKEKKYVQEMIDNKSFEVDLEKKTANILARNIKKKHLNRVKSELKVLENKKTPPMYGLITKAFKNLGVSGNNENEIIARIAIKENQTFDEAAKPFDKLSIVKKIEHLDKHNANNITQKLNQVDTNNLDKQIEALQNGSHYIKQHPSHFNQGKKNNFDLPFTQNEIKIIQAENGKTIAEKLKSLIDDKENIIKNVNELTKPLTYQEASAENNIKAFKLYLNSESAKERYRDTLNDENKKGQFINKFVDEQRKNDLEKQKNFYKNNNLDDRDIIENFISSSFISSPFLNVQKDYVKDYTQKYSDYYIYGRRTRNEV